MRTLFESGKQRGFLDLIRKKIKSPSMRAIKQFGIETKYSTLKSYYQEKRLMPRELVEDLCKLADVRMEKIKVKYLEENWGKKKGGERGMEKIIKKYSRDEIKKWRSKGGKSKKKTLIRDLIKQ